MDGEELVDFLAAKTRIGLEQVAAVLVRPLVSFRAMVGIMISLAVSVNLPLLSPTEVVQIVYVPVLAVIDDAGVVLAAGIVVVGDLHAVGIFQVQEGIEGPALHVDLIRLAGRSFGTRRSCTGFRCGDQVGADHEKR